MFFMLPLMLYVYMVMYGLAMLSYFMFNDALLMWFVMEINMMMFMGVAYMKDFNKMVHIMSYFLVQSYASFMMLMSIVLVRIDVMLFISYMLMQMSVFIKLAIFPFSSWFYPVVSQTSMLVLFFILVMQKWPVLMINYNYLYLINYDYLAFYFVFMMMLLLVSMFFSAVGSISSSGLIPLMIWSSMMNSVWLYLTTYTNSFVVVLYFVLYFISVLLVFVIYSFYKTSHNQFQGLLFFNLIGLPPLPMFFVKLSIISLLLNLYGGKVLYFMVLGMLFAVVMMVAYTRYYLFVTMYELQVKFHPLMLN